MPAINGLEVCRRLRAEGIAVPCRCERLGARSASPRTMAQLSAEDVDWWPCVRGNQNCSRRRLVALFLCALALTSFSGSPQPAIDWQKIRNPVYAHEGWSVKDAAMVVLGENIYVFFSAFFFDNGRERCHVSAVRTRDFLTFTEPLFIWSGADCGFWGFCSPNISRVGDTFVLTYNSWGDKDGQPNQLFYATSRARTLGCASSARREHHTRPTRHRCRARLAQRKDISRVERRPDASTRHRTEL